MSDLSILDYRVMTGLVEKFPSQGNYVLSRFFPRREVDSDKIEFDIIYNSRGFSIDYIPKDAESRPSKPLGATQKTASLAFVKKHIALKESQLLFERRPGTMAEPWLLARVGRELQKLNDEIDRLGEWARSQAIFTGKFAVDNGHVKFQVDFEVPTDHLNVAPATPWNQSDAKILDDIAAWKKKIAEDSGEAAAVLVCNSTTMRYLVNNSEIRELMQYEYGYQLSQTGRINRLLELDILVYDGMYVDDQGNYQYYVPNNKVLVSTAPGSWGEFLIGPSLVPAGSDDSVAKVIGRFSYAEVKKDPVAYVAYVGESHLPIIYKPENYLVAQIV